jgi:hypothetical protein
MICEALTLNQIVAAFGCAGGPPITVPLQMPAFLDVTLNVALFTGVTVTTALAPLPHVAGSSATVNA